MSSAKNSLSVRPKSFKNRETGSPFDYTDIDAIKVLFPFFSLFPFHLLVPFQRIPGSHQNVPSRDIDVSAFSLSKRTKKEVPDTFLKKGSGFGGALVRLLPSSVPPCLASFHLAHDETCRPPSRGEEGV